MTTGSHLPLVCTVPDRWQQPCPGGHFIVQYNATLEPLIPVSVGCFTPYRQLGSFSRGEPVWRYSVLVEKKFGLFQSWVIESMR